MGCCFAFTSPAGASLIISSRFPQNLGTEGARCGAEINVLALVVYLSKISIMRRPTQAEGELKTFATF